MKSVQISLYRIALICGRALSSAHFPVRLFSLVEEIALPRRQPARDGDRRPDLGAPATDVQHSRTEQWLIGLDSSIYHYGFFDPPGDVGVAHGVSPSCRTLRQLASADLPWPDTVMTDGRRSKGRDAGILRRGPPKWRAFAQQPIPLLSRLTVSRPRTAPTPRLMTVAQLRRPVRELSAGTGANVVPPAG